MPVYMACQWTDEQTGGHCADLAEHFTGTSRKWFTFTNGTHVDSLDPATFNRWYDFLELYVAQETPIVDSAAVQLQRRRLSAGVGITGITLPAIRSNSSRRTVGAGRVRAAAPIRVLFDNGAGEGRARRPDPAFEHSFELPDPGHRRVRGTCQPTGTGTSRRRATDQSFQWNARASP